MWSNDKFYMTRITIVFMGMLMVVASAQAIHMREIIKANVSNLVVSLHLLMFISYCGSKLCENRVGVGMHCKMVRSLPQYPNWSDLGNESKLNCCALPMTVVAIKCYIIQSSSSMKVWEFNRDVTLASCNRGPYMRSRCISLFLLFKFCFYLFIY